MLWFDECHEFRPIEPAWLFGIVQCERENMPLRFSDGENVVVVRYSQCRFIVNGDSCARPIFEDICRLGQWLGHEVSPDKKLDRRFEDLWIPSTSRQTRHIHARKVHTVH